MVSTFLAPVPPHAGVVAGTWIQLDPDVRFIDRDLLAGGAPWRLLRLRGRSYELVQRWREGATVAPGEEHFARTLVAQGFAHPRFDPVEAREAVDALEVVIPSFNDANHLDRLLSSLAGLSVTVVDDASSDPHVADVATRHGARLERHTINTGPSASRNDGARRTPREFLWFIDTDVFLDDAIHVAGQLLAHFRDPLVAAVAPRVIGAPGPRRRDHYEQVSGALDLGPHSGLVVPLTKVGYVPSACFMVRASAFRDGFDEELRVGEDVDLVWRLPSH